eukprot:TRINITY_DN57357_c0_g1_i1.p1 TRINITY_DN57357_c0_g1~~TRINITY_DN57357_c0_g1_i1.p1  ORF type:complete len:194 (+),score=20.28 TRINITY_DN57357_c0_g1_i1:72-653(+)
MIERRQGVAPLQRSRLTEATILSFLIEKERSPNPDFEHPKGSLTPNALLQHHGLVRGHSFAYLTDEHVARFPEIFASQTASIRDAHASACSGSSNAPRKAHVRVEEPSGSVAKLPGGVRAGLGPESLLTANLGGPIAPKYLRTREERAAAAPQRAATRRSCLVMEQTLDTFMSFLDGKWNALNLSRWYSDRDA